MDDTLKKQIAILLIMLLALLSFVLAMILLFQKPYRTTLVGTYFSADINYGSDDPPLGCSISFRSDGYYAKYSSNTLYETGTFEAEDAKGGVFLLSVDDSEVQHHVLVLRDGLLCFPKGDDLEFYRLVSEIPAIGRGANASWDFDENGFPSNIP